MKIFIDCEYNGMGGQLLSMALVPINYDQSKDYFYEELLVHEPLQEWVLENVVPKLEMTRGLFSRLDCPEGLGMRPYFQNKLACWLYMYDKVELIADWPDDIKYFCDMLITGPGRCMTTPPLNIEIRRDLDAVSEKPHHALSDALAMRKRYLEIISQT